MIIYKSTAAEFDLDVRYHKISDKLEDEFIKIIGRKPSDGESRSFKNSLTKMNEILVNESLINKDCGIMIEYMLPSSSMRLDFMITGKDKFLNKNAVIVELKQWDKVEESETARQVYTYTGGHYQDVNHPAVQVTNYKTYLEDYQTVFHKGVANAIKIYACSYLHNYRRKHKDDAIFDPKFEPYIEESPVFTEDDVKQIGTFIRSNVEKGDGIELIDQIEKSEIKPSKKLIEHVNNIIDAKNEFILVDDQLIVFDRVMQIVKDKKLDGTDGHFVVLVKGGPGTGKSVVGLNLLGRILQEGKECSYLAANAAFKNGLANKIDKNRSKVLFKHPYFYNKELTISKKMFQVAIIDEAHRISTTPPPMQKKLDDTLVEEIIKKTHLSVFFTDDNQMIRPNDIGSYSHVKQMALKANCTLYEYELNAQFRCAGSEGYLNWLDDVIGIRQTANASGWENMDGLEFTVFDDPNEMKDQIFKTQALGFNSRLVAGYAWPWSKELNGDGSLEDDVKIYQDGELIFHMPWNPQDSYKGRRGKGIPANTADWAVNPDGVNQIGCIHTAQGLEFDYVGVIVGEDFTYNLQEGCWVADVSKCYDQKIGSNSRDEYLRLAQNTYKTLLTRGIKGVYVYAVDEDTRTYLKQRLRTVKRVEDERFYHQKKVDLLSLFEFPQSLVKENSSPHKEQKKIELEQCKISKLTEDYMYCDITNERAVSESLIEMERGKEPVISAYLEKLLKDTPQVRSYCGLTGNYTVDAIINQVHPEAVVKRLNEGKLVYSFVCKKNK